MAVDKERWAEGVGKFYEDDFFQAIEEFESAGSNAKLLFNKGVAMMHIDQWEDALDCLDAALASDKYMVPAFYVRGTCHHKLANYGAAENDFSDVLKLLRTNDMVDYALLGLDFTVYRCDVHFNRALSRALDGRFDDALADVEQAKNMCGSDLAAQVSRVEELVQTAKRTGGGSTSGSIPPPSAPNPRPKPPRHDLAASTRGASPPSGIQQPPPPLIRGMNRRGSRGSNRVSISLRKPRTLPKPSEGSS